MFPRTCFFLALLGCFVPSLHAQRLTKDLVSDWRFHKGDVPAQAKTDDWEYVTVPHTWNAVDGADGKAAEPQYPEGYYRGPGWYERLLGVPTNWKGKRVFIRFEGVSLVADVLVNGISIGQHRGAFAAFCFDLTPFLKYDGNDTLRVRADNSRAFDVAPLSGDFTVFGGIYRPVQLFATDPVCVSPLDYASPGVFVTVKDLQKDSAQVEVKTLVSNGTPNPASVNVTAEIADARGASVGRGEKAVDLPAGATQTVVQTIAVAQPHLWSGRTDPYLYSAKASVARGGTTVDSVTQPLGIRTVAMTNDRGFLLNGQPYPLHGVNRHQDRAGRGWALLKEDHEQDHALIEEIGATTVRLAHYQQADYFHELSDRTGIIEWQEVPLVDTVGGSPQYLANARQQFTEMVLQTYNHPSIAMWGLFNELDAGWAEVKTAPAVPVIESLQKLAKELDQTRFTVGASWPQNASARHFIPDWICWNIYPGWYSAQPEDATAWINKYSGQVGKRIGISEYGAGANPAQYEEGDVVKPAEGGPYHPQEWQSYLHERLWAQFKDNPKLWGTWIWAMFDFAVDKRDEGTTPGINDKGMVTRDRRIKKDTFYFYKANWNPQPMVFITSRRATPRKEATTDIKVYSNCQEVELKVNGKSVGKATPDDIRICRWKDVELQPGTNKIEALAHVADEDVSDSCEWTLTEPQ